MDRSILNADPSRLINWFDDFEGPNKFRFLSNFYTEPFELWDHTFPSGEHAFQYAKWRALIDPRAIDDFEAALFAAPDSRAAKLVGRGAKINLEVWNAIRFPVMQEVVQAKFATTAMAKKLVATKSAYLMEGTLWNDTIWGVDLNQRGWPGFNWLGLILMAQRTSLRRGVQLELPAFDSVL